MSRKFFIKDTDYATEDTAGVVKVGNGLSINNGILSAGNGGASGSCIVCSPTQPADLKKGLWIKTDSTKDISITDCYNLIEVVQSCVKKSAVLKEGIFATSSCAINGKAYIFGGIHLPLGLLITYNVMTLKLILERLNRLYCISI